MAYSLLSYLTAWLKVHYPIEYLTSCLILENDNTKVSTLCSEIDRLGLKISLPDINESNIDFVPSENKHDIIYGFNGIKGLSTNGCNIIIANRPYKSFEDFLERVGLVLGKSDVISLIKANAFRNITKCTQMEQFEKYYDLRFNNGKEDKKPIKKVNKTHIKYLLDNGLIEPDEQEDKILCLDIINEERMQKCWIDFKEKYCSGNSLSWEMETVNAYLSADPFEDVYTGDWDKVTNKGKGYIGGVLISIKETTTKKGEKMCFLNISREDKIFDLVVFPRNYLEYKPLLKEGNCIVCKTEKQGDTKGIMQTCEPLKDFILRTRSLQKESVINRYVET